MSKAILDIAAERQRQKDDEGWTEAHDDNYRHGELERAAACYAVHEVVGATPLPSRSFIRSLWPWDTSWWKPTTTRRNLVKAAALIVAAIERLDRIEASKQP